MNNRIKNAISIPFIILSVVLYTSIFARATETPIFPFNAQVKTTQGILQGVRLTDDVLAFKGTPYAAAPVGELRWKAPQPPEDWKGIRLADKFGARPIQESNLLYEFRSEEMSEDCLFLNVWTPALSDKEKLPVYIFIHGGSFIRGDGSQAAYDGTSMAQQGIVYVSINYRLGVFGFMSHPGLSEESAYKGSGNYGLMDQVAAMQWVKENIAAFGGDPNRVTIGGESVGAQSVSAHMVSPLSRGLFSAAIAESGSLTDVRPLVISLQKSEEMGTALSGLSKTTTIAELRAMSAKKLLKLAGKGNPRRFKPVIDGYFLTEYPEETFTADKQAKVPLLIGWNAQEVPAAALFRLKRINAKNYKAALKKIYGEKAEDVLELYPSGTNAEIKKASGELMSDRLINYSSWKLAELHAKSGDIPVYRYLFAHPHPGLNQKTIREGNFFKVMIKKLINKTITGTSFHASEIEYALGNLDIQDNYAWRDEDYRVSKQMQTYFSEFIKTGNPNSLVTENLKLINWPRYLPAKHREFIRLQSESKIETSLENKRYLLFESLGGGY